MSLYTDDEKYIKDLTDISDLNKYNTVECVNLNNGNFGISLSHYEDYELPTVSVLTVTHNRDYIFDIAIRNWTKFIYPKDKIEWIILDDSTVCSTIKDKLPDDARIKYIKLDYKISTIGGKRNRGIEYCSNDIICFMDDDDYYFPDSIMNRVKVLLMYKKDVVGSVSINCVNLIDNTSFITGGGIFKFKNGDKALICAEASLGFYKTYWEKQKFDEIVLNEEIIDFTRNSVNSFINLHGSYIMIAFSHGRNMSSRALSDSINISNFLEELDVNTVNFIEDLRLKILMHDDDNKIALDFYKKIVSKGLGSYAIYKKINSLPKKVQKSPIIKELRKQNPLFKVAPKGSVNILYFYLCYNTKIEMLDRYNPDIHVLEIYVIAGFLSSRQYNVTLYMYTDDEFVVDNFKIRPYWKYSPNDACETTIVYREIGILTENIKTDRLYFLGTDNITDVKNISMLKKCDEIWVDNIMSKITLKNKLENKFDNIHVFSLLDLSNISEKYSKNKEFGAITIFVNLTSEEIDIIKNRFSVIYSKGNCFDNKGIDGVKYINNLYSVNTEYILTDLSHLSLLYAKHSNSKLCLINNFSDPIGINLDYCELPLNFLNCSKTNYVLDRLFPYTRAVKK